MQMSENRGFSLVEVNLAIMLVALGLLVLFSLFPAGLSQGARAHADTQATLFGGHVLNTIRANAAQMNWAQWSDSLPAPNDFVTLLLDDLNVVETGSGNVANAIQFTTGNYVRYMLDISPINGTDLWAVSLWVRGGRYGPSNAETFRNRSKWFYTELFYSGMP